MRDMREAGTTVEAERQVAAGNAWYTSDQIATQRHGVYRHNMRLRYDYVMRRLRAADVEGKVVVDLGCGDGQWSIELAERFKPTLIGVDYNALRLDRYKANVPGAEARLGSCFDIPIADGMADTVMFHQVLEHLPEPSTALTEIARVLKPGGLLLVSVPNEGTWLKQRIQYRFIQQDLLAQSDHVNFYTADTLRNQLERGGFLVDRVDAVGFNFPHQGISRRLVSWRPSFEVGVRVARLIPSLHDCLFAWCRKTV